MNTEAIKAAEKALAGINKVGVPIDDKPPTDFRSELMAEIMEDHPNLTFETLDRHMRLSGF